MKKMLSLFFLILPALITNSCLIGDDVCVACDIYDYRGYWMEYYGTECGTALRVSRFEAQADDYAEEYYDGYALCDED